MNTGGGRFKSNRVFSSVGTRLDPQCEEPRLIGTPDRELCQMFAVWLAWLTMPSHTIVLVASSRP